MKVMRIESEFGLRLGLNHLINRFVAEQKFVTAPTRPGRHFMLKLRAISLN